MLQVFIDVLDGSVNVVSLPADIEVVINYRDKRPCPASKSGNDNDCLCDGEYEYIDVGIATDKIVHNDVPMLDEPCVIYRTDDQGEIVKVAIEPDRVWRDFEETEKSKWLR